MNKRKKSKLWLFTLILLIICFSPIILDQQRLLFAKDKEMNNVQRKIADEKKTKEELQSKKQMLNTDQYTEKIAREKFGMIKSNERVFVDVNK